MTFRGYHLGTLVRATVKEVGADRVTTLAAHTAYYFFFSLFPLLLFLAPLLTLFVDQATFMQMTSERLVSLLPPTAVEPITTVLRDVVFVEDAPGLISVGVLLAAWSGSNVFGALTTALNLAYDVEEFRPWWRRQVVRLGMLIVGGVVILAATVIMLGGEDVARAIGGVVGLSDEVVQLWTWIQYPLAFAFVVLFAFLTLYILPNVNQKKSHALAGATVVSVLWLAATLLFRLYVQHFPPNPAYGLIGGIMILLTWMYYTMFVVLVGGELASELHHGTAAVTPRQGATYFGRLVSGEAPGSSSRLA